MPSSVTARIAPLLVLVALTLAAPQSHARDITAQEIDRINVLVGQARAARNSGNHDRAIEHLRAALEIHELPFVVYSLARVYEDQAKYDDAQELYQRCLTPDADPETRARANEALIRVKALQKQSTSNVPEHPRTTTTGRLVIESTPPDVLVAVNDRPPRPLTSGGLELPVGIHRIRVIRDGYQPSILDIEIRPDETARLKVVLDASHRQLPDSTSSSSGIDAGTWVLIGGGAALVVGGVVSYVVGAGKHDELERAQRNATDGVVAMTRQEAAALRDDGTLFKTVGLAMGGLGLGAITTGIILAVTADDTPQSGVHVVGNPAGTLLGLGLQGRF